MKHLNRGRSVSRPLTGAALSALLVGAVLAATPAAQADAPANVNVNVTGSQIAPDETTYAGWHQGTDGATGRFGVSSEGLKQIGKSQVVYGYTDNSNSGLDFSGVNADLNSLIGAKYDVTKGDAWFQVPLFIDTDGVRSTPGVFATLRPVAGATADTTIEPDEMWLVSKPVPGIEANVPTKLSDIIAAITDRAYKTIGFGTFTDTGDAATVKSITFDGKTYTFTADPGSTETVPNADVKGTEADNYTSWHQGYPNAAARQYVTADGLELVGKSQVIKGFDDNDATFDKVNASLASALDDSSYTVDEGDAWFQIAVRSGNAAGGFTTLRTHATGTGTHSLADAQWLSNKAIGSIPAETATDIDDVVAALGTYKVIAHGVLTVPGESALVSNVTFNGASTDFADAGTTPTSETVKTIAPDETTYEGWHQGADDGNATIDDSTLKLGDTKSQVIDGYADNDNDGLAADGVNADLATVLPAASYTVVGGTVHFQVPLFSSNAAGNFTTLRPVDPADAGANAISITDQWTSSAAIDGSVAANEAAPLGDILSALGSYKVIGFGVYADAGANGVVKDITWDGVKYDFKTGPVVVPPVNTVKTTASVSTNAAGEAIVNISCTQACSGWAQLRADESAAKTSANVFYYKLAKAGWMPMKFTGLANANASWLVRIATEKPTAAVSFHEVTLKKGSTASVNVVKTTAGVKVSSSGKVVVNVSCTKACSGYAQLWSDGTGSRKSSNVVHYTLKKAGYQAMTFTGMPTGADKWDVRLAIAKPTPVAGTTPVFHNLRLL